MSSMNEDARRELMEKLNYIYMNGSGYSGGKGTTAGAKKNMYLKYLNQFRGVPLNERPSYEEFKKPKEVKKIIARKKEEIKKIKKEIKQIEKNCEYGVKLDGNCKKKSGRKPGKKTGRRPGKKIGRKKIGRKKGKINPHLAQFNRCMKELRSVYPGASYRELQQMLKNRINYETNECQDEEQFGEGLDDYGGSLDDYEINY